MAIKALVCVVAYGLFGGTVDVNGYENITTNPLLENATVNGITDNVPSPVTVFVPTSIDDFIVINLSEYMKLRRFGLTTKGRFGTNGLWVADRNGTNYLLVRKSREEQQKELEEALQNTTGSTVCFDGLCVDRNLAEQKLESIEAVLDRRLLPGNVTPFSVMVSFFVIAAVFGITGNILILMAIITSKSNRNSTNVLICSLAVSDILVLAFCLPMQVLQTFFHYFGFFDNHICRFWVFMKYSSIILSVFTMAAMALERYIAVCHPLKAKSYCTAKNARRIVGFIWVISIAVSSPVVLLVFRGEEDKRCLMSFGSHVVLLGFYGAFALVVFVIPLVVMLPLYVRTFRVLWKSTSEASKLKGAEDQTKAETEQINVRKQVIKMLVLVLMMFVVCWGPSVIYDFTNVVRQIVEEKEQVKLTTNLGIGLQSLGLCNSFINPMLYTAMSRQFQLYLKSLFLCTKSQGPKSSAVASNGNSQSKFTSQEALSQ